MRENDERSPGSTAANLLDATEARRMLADGRLSAERLVLDCLSRIDARDARIGAWTHVASDGALRQARRMDRAEPSGVLHGIPVAVKDVLDTADMPTTYGSAAYAHHQPARDSDCVAAVRSAGAIVLGKTTTTEFASPVGVGVRNPCDLARTAGVSSSGSAAAVADRMVPLAIGTQTGGSVIRPAAYCGVFGFKPTIDRIDRGGIRHLRPSLDSIGLFGRSLADVGLLFAGLTRRESVAPIANLPTAPRIGMCRTGQWPLARPETQRALERAATCFRRAGASVADVELPHEFDDALAAFEVIVIHETASTLAREFRDHLDTMNDWLRATADKRRSISTDDYANAQHTAERCRSLLSAVFDDVDALITPATAGEASTAITGLEDATFCPLWTLLHGPCLTIPAFVGPHGLPMGMQVVGRAYDDDRLLESAAWMLQALAPMLPDVTPDDRHPFSRPYEKLRQAALYEGAYVTDRPFCRYRSQRGPFALRQSQ